MLGGTNVQASAPEARDVLERGVADGIFFPWGSMFLFGLDKVTKYHIDAPLYSTVFTYSMNKAKYDAMSPAQKKVIDDHCTTEWAVKLSSPWHDFEAAGRAKMKAAPGHEVYALTPDQLKAWKASVAPLAEGVGRGGQEGRRRSRRALQGLRGDGGEVPGGVLISSALVILALRRAKRRPRSGGTYAVPGVRQERSLDCAAIRGRLRSG